MWMFLFDGLGWKKVTNIFVKHAGAYHGEVPLGLALAGDTMRRPVYD
jgi:hypothetical protein